MEIFLLRRMTDNVSTWERISSTQRFHEFQAIDFAENFDSSYKLANISDDKNKVILEWLLPFGSSRVLVAIKADSDVKQSSGRTFAKLCKPEFGGRTPKKFYLINLNLGKASTTDESRRQTSEFSATNQSPKAAFEEAFSCGLPR